MGTTYVNDTAHLTPTEFIRKQIECERNKILAISLKGSVAYMACQYRDGDGKTHVYGLVCQLFKDGNDRGYKPVEETMGPFESDCPARILDLLTPTDSQYANEWRERCRNRAATKQGRPKVGQVIRFNAPLKFSDGSLESEFTISKKQYRGRNTTVYQGKNGRDYRITGINRMKYEVVSSR
jgi:hypothetical protein